MVCDEEEETGTASNLARGRDKCVRVLSSHIWIMVGSNGATAILRQEETSTNATEYVIGWAGGTISSLIGRL